ncbi:MAG: response regulator transcription factor [Candidatus Pacebacteria bacterium]|nr:response regulator transcription factor [Candidatus Paceibacterota bacterium]
MRILIVEDEEGIAAFLKAGLESEYFAVDVAEDGEQGSYLARTNDYDIIVLDNMLPKKTGSEVCEEIRKDGKNTPIIMLSAVSELGVKVELLNKGADDYLTKPFSLEELIARIRALLRRPKAVSSEILQIDDLIMDTKRHVTKRGDKEIYLTRKEFMLLELLMKKGGSVVSRGAIMEHVWDMNVDPFSNTIESHILNIRKKISVKGKSELISTLPGIGYKIDIK